jgi:IS30 family transposase
MTRRPQPVQAEELTSPAAMTLKGVSLRRIASALGRSPSTLSRELA